MNAQTDTQLTINELMIDKTNLQVIQSRSKSFDLSQLQDHQAVLQVNSFGFSANNITYGLLGEKMGYWGFFPADEGYGILPVWGFATVTASKHPGIEVGERVFGYLPLASHLVITADKVNANGFYDANPDRKSISPVYDHYVRCATDPGYQADKEDWQLNYRPLFMTSFVLDDYVGEHLTPEVKNIVLTSASSKTAYGSAFLLKQHKQARDAHYNVIGLTSAANIDFTKQIGCYDQVLSYDEYATTLNHGATWVLDFAGNKSLLLDLQRFLAEQLHKMVFIGVTDVQAQGKKVQGELNGELFFAPAQVKKRTAEWGGQGFLQRYASAWLGFSGHMSPYIQTRQIQGVENIIELYKQGVAGQFNTSEMNVVLF